MIRFLTGVVVGIAVATVGFSGLATMADTQIEKFKTLLKETSK